MELYEENELEILQSITDRLCNQGIAFFTSRWCRPMSSYTATAAVSAHFNPSSYGGSMQGNVMPVIPSANIELEKQKQMLQRKHHRSAPRPNSGYVCRRCGGSDHFLENCPTNGDPNYDKSQPQLTQAQQNMEVLTESKVRRLMFFDLKHKCVSFLQSACLFAAITRCSYRNAQPSFRLEWY